MIKLVPTPKFSNIIDADYHEFLPRIATTNEKWNMYTESFSEIFEKIFETIPEKGNEIELVLDHTVNKGAYKIDTRENIKIHAADDEGILYGLSSLIQLINKENDAFSIQKFIIEDYPDKDYRAFMVDLGREWHPFDKLLRFVDVCFLIKIKYLHLHFIDNKIYSLPSKVFPKLPSDGKHYSFEQIHILNEYAKTRGIVLIPEYECPGHADMFTEKYPEIFCDKFENGDLGEFYTETGALINSKSLICAGSETTWEATKAILKEICDMFPDAPYINIGGDEACINLWTQCSECKEYMRKNNIGDEYELYSDYIARVTDYIFTLGKTPIVWEGFPKKGHEKINKDTIVIAWESHYHLVGDLLKEGFRVINSSWQPLYIVPCINARWGVYDILKWNVYNWQHWWEKSHATLNPITVEPTEKVLGAMLCSWQQFYEQEIQHAVENLSAMCERTWNTTRVCTDDEFLEKFKPFMMPLAAAFRDR